MTILDETTIAINRAKVPKSNTYIKIPCDEGIEFDTGNIVVYNLYHNLSDIPFPNVDNTDVVSSG